MDIEEFNQKKAELKDILSKHGKSMLQQLFTELLSSGVIKEVRWYQYTPYFKDGDPCVFGVDLPQYKTRNNEKEYDEDPWSCGSFMLTRPTRFDDKPNEYYDPEAAPLIEAFEKQFNKVEDLLLDVFGDHQIIRAYLTDTGEVEFEAEWYEHD